MLRRRRLDVDDRRDCEEVVQKDRVEEGLVQNADVEVDVDEVLEVDVLQWTKTMSKRKAKSMSTLEVEAKRCHQVGKDLVEEDDVEEVVRKMVMCRCGCGGLLPMASREDLDGTRALLPCQMVQGFHLKGVPNWVDQKSLGSRRCVESMHGHWSPLSCRLSLPPLLSLCC